MNWRKSGGGGTGENLNGFLAPFSLITVYNE